MFVYKNCEPKIYLDHFLHLMMNCQINGRRCWTAQIQDGYKTLYIPNICNEWTKDDVSVLLLNYISTQGEKVQNLVAHAGLFCCVAGRQACGIWC